MSQTGPNDEDFWDKIFDKSKATKLPDKFPGDDIKQSLLLEDVNEVVTEELDENAYSQIQHQEAAKKHYAHGQSEEKSKFSAFLKTKKSLSPCKSYENATIAFKQPSELSTSVDIGKEEEKKNHADEEWKIEKEDDVVDLGTVEEKHDAKWSEDDSKAVDPETRLGGVDESVYLHTIESETVAELEEILVLEKAKIDLKNGIDVIKGRDITLEEAKNLRFLLFGSSASTFDDVWMKQNIRLNQQSHHALRYHKGQTDGVMSCIQACLLKHLLFGDVSSEVASSEVIPPIERCLHAAIVGILWQAGMNQKATVCLPTSKKDILYSTDLKLDGVIEKIRFYEFLNKDDLEDFLQRNFHFFDGDGRPGVVIFLYSLIMSRSIERVSEDIENSFQCLIQQGSCSQTLLNLLLGGKATPHVFNMNKEIERENGKMETHYGICKRSELGFLSSIEAEDPKRLTVGSMLKTPLYPIWVAFLKNHHCILFSKKRNLLSDWKLERRFELFYFGGLPRNVGLKGEEIRLTIDTVRPFDPDEYDYEFNSDLEDTIRTKWQDCVIDWNGSRRF